MPEHLTPLERELLEACEWARDALSTKALGLQRRALERIREAIAAAETGRFVRCKHDQSPSTCTSCVAEALARKESEDECGPGSVTPLVTPLH